LLNAVTAPEGVAHAVLFRAVEPIEGVEHMMERRARNTLDVSVTNGPGKLTQAMGIRDCLNGEKLTHPEGCMCIGDSGIYIPTTSIVSGPRVGMSPLTKVYGHFPWRFFIKNNRWVSKPWHVSYNW
ncbi:MAG TPA: DNA-3-methyladenine glycosylase, partial [Saprospiraceae bacterium]|nr:DNA-3-methyladenine glycosylase [Saprospiraceae bacterium]